ncbi:MAG: radical SAM protein [Planctomycetes bacterium]|nr:radical SAM protein [Planctomycetota bacterium]
MIAIWEATRACDLACRHCRAEAVPGRDIGELSTAEACALLDRIHADFGPILFVITGGDPLKRDDLETIIAHGARLGLSMGLTPSATPLLTGETLRRLHAAGLARLAISLDGADATTHDAFRGVAGTFVRSIPLLEEARRLGLSTQINSSIGRHNEHQLPALAQLGGLLGISLWSVFLLVPTGRAGAEMLLTAAEHERTYRQLASIALDPATTFTIKTTAGQPYYRVLEQERRRRGLTSPVRRGQGVNDGNGFVFVSHIGDICPSGFLPLACGNVRHDDLATVYRDHQTFRRLRTPDKLSGKCGRCPFNRVCGGSRSRTHALTGDAFASDPTCVYQPAAA